MFENVKLDKNPDWEKHSYFEYDIGFDSCSPFSNAGFDWGKSVVIFGVNKRSSVQIDKKKKYILVYGESTTQRSDDSRNFRN